MDSPGRLLASGRDADIFEYRPGLVLRRSRHTRSMAAEARTMEYLQSQGYPVPAVEEISDDGFDLVMERIDGVSMVEAIGQAPWTVRRHANTLADLHQRLHEVKPPDFLSPAEVGKGEQILHLDLHPLNIMIGPKGPVVIDWTGASLGDPYVDVALAWLLMTAGTIPGGGMKTKVLGFGRSLLTNGFVARFDRSVLIPRLEEVVAWKAHDPNLSAAEIDGMWAAARKLESAG